MTQPASGEWISGRVLVLLSHYFTMQSDAHITAAIAQDWIDILSGYPQWAIDKACKKYLAGPNCSRKPIQGNILQLVKGEMLVIKDAENVLDGKHEKASRHNYGNAIDIAPLQLSEKDKKERKEFVNRLLKRDMSGIKKSETWKPEKKKPAGIKVREVSDVSSKLANTAIVTKTDD
jgi:hypothetical protein